MLRRWYLAPIRNGTAGPLRQRDGICIAAVPGSMQHEMTNHTTTHESDGHTSLAHTIAYYAAGGPRSIERRLGQLKGEWALDRAVMLGGAVLGLVGLLAARRTARPWLLVPVVSLGWLLQQAWTATGPFSRWLHSRGLRTSEQIQAERLALKTLRGDFRNIPPIAEGRDPAAIETLLGIIRR